MEEQPTPIHSGNNKPPRTAASITQQIENDLTEQRLKELKGKARKIIEEISTAENVVKGKRAELAALYEDYADVVPA